MFSPRFYRGSEPGAKATGVVFMTLKRIPGLPGLIYVPDSTGPKKHNCKDCFFCQFCSDEKCSACLKRKSKKRRKKRK